MITRFIAGFFMFAWAMIDGSFLLILKSWKIVGPILWAITYAACFGNIGWVVLPLIAPRSMKRSIQWSSEAAELYSGTWYGIFCRSIWALASAVVLMPVLVGTIELFKAAAYFASHGSWPMKMGYPGAIVFYLGGLVAFGSIPTIIALAKSSGTQAEPE